MSEIPPTYRIIEKVYSNGSVFMAQFRISILEGYPPVPKYRYENLSEERHKTIELAKQAIDDSICKTIIHNYEPTL